MVDLENANTGNGDGGQTQLPGDGHESLQEGRPLQPGNGKGRRLEGVTGELYGLVTVLERLRVGVDRVKTYSQVTGRFGPGVEA